MGTDGSSSSVSGSGWGVPVRATSVSRARAAGMGLRGSGVSSVGGRLATGVGAAAAGVGAGAGVSSTVEWVPVVQGGMARNSSKVRTRGLQHFQPGGWWSADFPEGSARWCWGGGLWGKEKRGEMLIYLSGLHGTQEGLGDRYMAPSGR